MEKVETMKHDEYSKTAPIRFPVFGAYLVTQYGAITMPGDRLVLCGVVGRWSEKGFYVQTKLEFRLHRKGEEAKDIEMNAKTFTARMESGAYQGIAGAPLPGLDLIGGLNEENAPEVLPLVEGADLWEIINGRENPERLRTHAQQYERVKKGDNFRHAVIYVDLTKEFARPNRYTTKRDK